MAQPALDLAATIEAHDRAVRIAEEYHNRVLGPAFKAYRAACDAIPHRTTKSITAKLDGTLVPMSTADRASVEIARRHLSVSKSLRDSDFKRCCRELVAADDEREAELRRIKSDHHISELSDRYDELLNGSDPHWQAAREYPVRTLAEAIRKIEFLAGDENCEVPVQIILADLRRIAGRAA